MTTTERLTRAPGEELGDDQIGTNWQAPRDALRAELAPASLANRLLADGIEGIACRAWHDGYDRGYSAGSDSAFSDALSWLRMHRARGGAPVGEDAR